MQKFLTLTFILFALVVPTLAQTKLQTLVDIRIHKLFMGAMFEYPDTKYTEDGKKAEFTMEDGGKVTAQIELNPLNARSLLQGKNVDTEVAKIRFVLGSIRLETSNLKSLFYPQLAFDIKIGESTYRCGLGQFNTVEAPLVALYIPEEIRIPIDRMNTAILKFETKVFLNESGTFPIECDLSIETSAPARRTRRR